MPRPRNASPQPRNHKGAAVLDVWRGNRREQKVLGPWKSKEADIEYKRFLAEYASGAFNKPDGDATLAELFVAFLEHADRHYVRPDGTATVEPTEFRILIKLVREMYGDTLAREFGPRKLQTVRETMIARGWCRNRVNHMTNRLRRIFRWATAEEIVPYGVLESLRAVAGLQAGRTAAPETEPVKPVDDAIVDATLPFLNRTVAGLVRFHRLVGCRPAEAVAVRRCDIDTTGPVWIYNPPMHKTSWRGKSRSICIGPQAQAVLAEFPTDSPDDFIFSPRRELAERNAKRAANRKTKFYASRQGWQTRAETPKRSPGMKYSTVVYGRAIARACDDNGITRWSPNQLRHSFGTRVRKQYSLEHAQAGLGHLKADVTQRYAELNLKLAAEVAAEIG